MKTFSLVFLTLLFSLNACNKADELTQIQLPYDETIIVPATLGINLPFNIPTPDITLHTGSTIKLNKIQKVLVEEAKLECIVLTIKEPSYADFSFLEAIRICITAEDLPELEIAWSDPVPESASNTLELETCNDELREYIKADQFMLIVKTTTDELLGHDHHIDLHCVFWLDLRLF